SLRHSIFCERPARDLAAHSRSWVWISTSLKASRTSGGSASGDVGEAAGTTPAGCAGLASPAPPRAAPAPTAWAPAAAPASAALLSGRKPSVVPQPTFLNSTRRDS